jgi:hypothetical protein
MQLGTPGNMESEEDEMQQECRRSLTRVFELLGGCLFEEASAACEQQRLKKLDLAVPLYRGESITDLLTRLSRAEGEFLNLTEASEQQRKHLQDTYTSLSQEAALVAHRGVGSAEKGASSRRSSAATQQATPSAWLEDFSILMRVRAEMIRVLRVLSQHDALTDVREHIFALRSCVDGSVVIAAPLLTQTASSNGLRRSNSHSSSTLGTTPMATSHSSSSLIKEASIGGGSFSNSGAASSFNSISSNHMLTYNSTTAGTTCPSPLVTSPKDHTRGADPAQPPSSSVPSSSSSVFAILRPLQARVDDERRSLLGLLEAYHGIMNYDFLAATQVSPTPHKMLVKPPPPKSYTLHPTP